MPTVVVWKAGSLEGLLFVFRTGTSFVRSQDGLYNFFKSDQLTPPCLQGRFEHSSISLSHVGPVYPSKQLHAYNPGAVSVQFLVWLATHGEDSQAFITSLQNCPVYPRKSEKAQMNGLAEYIDLETSSK